MRDRRTRSLVAAIAALSLVLSAYAIRSVEVGFAQYETNSALQTFSSTPTHGVTLPDDATGAIIQAHDQAIRWTYSTTYPSATVGHVLAAGSTMVIPPNERRLVETFRWIEETAGAKVTVSFVKE